MPSSSWRLLRARGTRSDCCIYELVLYTDVREIEMDVNQNSMIYSMETDDVENLVKIATEQTCDLVK